MIALCREINGGPTMSIVFDIQITILSINIWHIYSPNPKSFWITSVSMLTINTVKKTDSPELRIIPNFFCFYVNH